VQDSNNGDGGQVKNHIWPTKWHKYHRDSGNVGILTVICLYI